MHGIKFIEELISQSKATDRKTAVQAFVQLFLELITGTKNVTFTGFIGDDNHSIVMNFRNLTDTQHKQIEDFLAQRLQPNEYHAEGGAAHPAAGNPKGYTPIQGESIYWFVKTEAALNILLPAVGFKAPPRKSIADNISQFLFSPADSSDDEDNSDDADNRKNSYFQCKLM